MLFNKRDAAEYCRVSIETIDKAREQGKLSYVKQFNRVTFTKEMLDDYIALCTVKGNNVKKAGGRV